MIEHSNTESVIKDGPQRQATDIALHHVNIFCVTGGRQSRIDRIAEIDYDHIACAPLAGELQVPALTAAAVEHDFVFEEFRLHRTKPAEKLVAILLVVLIEVRPFPTEVRARSGFLHTPKVEQSLP